MDNKNAPLYATSAGKWMLERFYQRTLTSVDWLAADLRLRPDDLQRVRAMCHRLQVCEAVLEDLMEDVAWAHRTAAAA